MFYYNRNVTSTECAWASKSVKPALSARGIKVPFISLALIGVVCSLPVLEYYIVSLLLTPFFLMPLLLRYAAAHHITDRKDIVLPDNQLPTVTVLVPVYKEAESMPTLMKNMRNMDYPQNKLEILVLCEKKDVDTIKSALLHRPICSNIRVVEVPNPDGGPTTKPRACNVGLLHAQGDVVVIFDGEDRPERDQIKKAASKLMLNRKTAVVQCRLACDHSKDGPLITKLWDLEYRSLFNYMIPTLAKANLPFLIGGTSNYFKKDILIELGGWDAFNVTEDADLAVRLARAGYKSDYCTSTTWEEAPVTVGAWVNQRSRWLKGFLITTLVHMRHPMKTARELGFKNSLALITQLPAALLCVASHPAGLYMLMTGRTSDILFIVLSAGYLAALVLHLRACFENKINPLVCIVLPVYWLLHFVALIKATLCAIRCVTYWNKTEHGKVQKRG